MTITRYFGLICEKSHINTITQSMIFIGSFFGFFAFSYIADNYGRKYEH